MSTNGFEREWDIALTNWKRTSESLRIGLAASLSRALMAKNYNRATVRVTDEGIMLIPYVGEQRSRGPKPKETAELPEWGNS